MMSDARDRGDESVVNVVLGDEAAIGVEATLDELRANGLKIRRYRPSLRIASGTVPAAAVAALTAVPGVRSVEPDRPVDLPGDLRPDA